MTMLHLGQDLNEHRMTSDLHSCLIADEELMAFKSGAEFPDPFPTDI